MLTENDVVNAVSAHLKQKGYNIDQALTTSQQGVDIVATHPVKGKCFVEAKGATSSKKDSSRFGKEFNASQIKVHIGMALVQSFKTIQKYPNSLISCKSSRTSCLEPSTSSKSL